MGYNPHYCTSQAGSACLLSQNLGWGEEVRRVYYSVLHRECEANLGNTKIYQRGTHKYIHAYIHINIHIYILNRQVYTYINIQMYI